MKKIYCLLLLVQGFASAFAQSSGLPSPGDILSPNRPTGTLAYQKNEYATVAAAATINLLNYTGGSPGYVDRLYMALGDASSAIDPSNMTVNIYLDGSGTATISIPLQNFLLGTYVWNSGPGAASSPFTTMTSGHPAGQTAIGGYFTLPIPFNSQVKIDLVNTTAATFTVWSVAEYQTGVPNTWPYTRVLRASVNTNVSGIAANAVTNLVNYTGGSRGRLVGMWLLEDDFPGSVTPHAASLEGNINLYLDGSGTASVQSSGTEDWFGLAFYVAGTGIGGTGGGTSSQLQGGWKDASGQVGLSYISGTANLTEGMFRFHLQDARYFKSGLKMTWACGDTTQVSFTGTCDLYSTVFYYTEN